MPPEAEQVNHKARANIGVLEERLGTCQRDLDRLGQKVGKMGERMDEFHGTLQSVASDVKTLVGNGASNSEAANHKMDRRTRITVAVIAAAAVIMVGLINWATTAFATKPIIAEAVVKAVRAAVK